MTCEHEVYHRTETIGNGITHHDTFTLPCFVDITKYLVSVQVKLHKNDGVNAGMMFYGAGSTMATGHQEYGGIVYVYTDNKVMIWRPVENGKGSVVNIGQRWGSGALSQSSDVADIVIRVYELKERGCAVPEDGVNATYTFYDNRVGGKVDYSCNNGTTLILGELTRFCDINQTWYGVPPVCGFIEDGCPEPEDGVNATYTFYDNRVGGKVVYSCNNETTLIVGELTRFCDINHTWYSVPPVCGFVETRCPLPGDGSNASYITYDNRVGGNVIYACYKGMEKISGDLIRYCQVNYTWNGLRPVCTMSELQDFEFIYRVDAKNTSKYRRSLISVLEDRTSAMVIGGSGVVALVAILSVILLPDLYKMFQHMRRIENVYNIKK